MWTIPQGHQDSLVFEISVQLIDHSFDARKSMPCHSHSRGAPHLGSYNTIPMIGLHSYLTSYYTYAKWATPP